MPALFQKNIFSTGKPEFARLTAKQAAPILEVMSCHYPALRVSRVSQVRAFGINSQNWKVDCGKDAYVLKRVSAKAAKTLAAQARWVEALSRNGFPAMRFYPVGGKTLVARDKKYAYCLSRFGSGDYLGRSPARWTSLLRHERKLADYCRKHSADLKKEMGSRDFFTADESRVVARLNKAKWRYVSDKYTELGELYRNEHWTRCIFHVDAHPLNVLFRGSELSLLTDFDSFRMTTLEISLGFSVFKCSRELLTGLRGRGLSKKVRSLKKSYERVFGPGFERILLCGQMDVLKRALYILNEISRGGSSRWKFMLKTQISGLKEIDAMLSLLKGSR